MTPRSPRRSTVPGSPRSRHRPRRPGLAATSSRSEESEQSCVRDRPARPGGPSAFAAVPVSTRVIRLSAGALLCAFVAFGATPAVAATITAPSRSPYAVPPGPGAFAVVATGFTPMANIFVEQCDGVAPTTPQWSPTINCDLGSAPPPASADANGIATFDGSRIFQPFVGESPQGLFNCLATGQRPPSDHLRSYTNCQLRV